MNNQYDEQIQLLLRSQRWKMAFFGLIILIAGLFIGAAVALLLMQRRHAQQLPGVEFINERTISHLQHELNLNPDQTEQIREICSKHLQALQEIREQARPQIANEMNELHTEVMAVLDEAQQKLWTQNIERLIDRFAAPPHEQGPHRPGPPPGRPPGRQTGAPRPPARRSRGPSNPGR